MDPPTRTISSTSFLAGLHRHDLADGAEGLLEEVVVELLEAGAGEGLGEVDAVVEGLDLGASLVLGGEGALDALGLAAQLLHGALVLGDVESSSS